MFAAISNSLRQSCLVASRVRTVQVARPFSALVNNRLQSSKTGETDAEFDQRYINYFSRPDIDGWEIRKGMTDIHALDLVPEPSIVIAALKACRRVNDYALAVRILESVNHKCGPSKKTIWPYIVQEIKPACEELGILLPEEMGYEKPELWKEVHHD